MRFRWKDPQLPTYGREARKAWSFHYCLLTGWSLHVLAYAAGLTAD